MINGVIIKELVTHSDNRGFFREIFRFSEDFKSVPVSQLSHSLVNQGTVKAWHAHKIQSQWNYVLTGLASVVLYDNRIDSLTHGESIDILVGDDQEPTAYFFPPGVLHGYKCLQGPMHIMYVTSGVYDLNDEVRVALKEHPNICDW
jgi:dTDP-4-dehydrorhamnose 3,5-epimerase